MLPGGVCRRVVLDSVYFRHAPAYLLRELAARGFKIQVSWIAFGELWAKASRDDDLEVLASRVRALDRIVEPHDPLHPTGVQLVQRLGGTIRGPSLVRPHEQFLARGAAFWRQLADSACDAKTVLDQGKSINSEIDGDAAGWLRANEDAVSLGERAREIGRAHV